MAHAFKTISAKPTFGTLKEHIYQSDYINRKKGIIAFCSLSCNLSPKYFPSYNVKNSFNVNKSNLIVGQYTKLNLNDICTIENIDPTINPEPCSDLLPCEPCQNNTEVIINPLETTPFYWSHQIDPLGQLFGKTQCGELNYTHYMEYF